MTFLKNNFFRIIAGLEMVSSLCGIYIGIFFALKGLWYMVLFLLPLIVFSFISGYLLWQGSPKGFFFSQILQLLSILSIEGSFFDYKVSSGAELGFIIRSAEPTIRWFVSLFCFNERLAIHTGRTEYLSIGVNFIAIWFFDYLSREKKRRFEQNKKE